MKVSNASIVDVGKRAQTEENAEIITNKLNNLE